MLFLSASRIIIDAWNVSLKYHTLCFQTLQTWFTERQKLWDRHTENEKLSNYRAASNAWMRTIVTTDLGICQSLSRGRAVQNGWTDRRPVWGGDTCGLEKYFVRWGPHPHGEGQETGCGLCQITLATCCHSYLGTLLCYVCTVSKTNVLHRSAKWHMHNIINMKYFWQWIRIHNINVANCMWGLQDVLSTGNCL